MRIYYCIFSIIFRISQCNIDIVIPVHVKYRERPKARSRPKLNDQWYNLNQISFFEEIGIDTSHLNVVNPDLYDHNWHSRVPRLSRATLSGDQFNEWFEIDPSDGKIVIPWSVMDGYPYEYESELAMQSLRYNVNVIPNNITSGILLQ